MGLIVAAAITTGLALATIGVAAWRAARPADRGVLVTALLIALPLQPLAFYLVRLPLDGALRAMLGIGIGKGWAIAGLFYAPLTEEPAKWLTIAAPVVRRALAPASTVPMALAIGLGFGIGEIWFLAHAIVSSPSYPDLPFWMFYGFVIERIEVCLLHGVFVAPALLRLAQGRSFWPGALAGVLLHFLTNFPIYPARIDLFGLGTPAWRTILMAWVAGLAAVGAVMLWRLHRRLTRAPVPA